jgi:hypothetical protein
VFLAEGLDNEYGTTNAVHCRMRQIHPDIIHRPQSRRMQPRQDILPVSTITQNSCCGGGIPH